MHQTARNFSDFCFPRASFVKSHTIYIYNPAPGVRLFQEPTGLHRLDAAQLPTGKHPPVKLGVQHGFKLLHTRVAHVAALGQKLGRERHLACMENGWLLELYRE